MSTTTSELERLKLIELQRVYLDQGYEVVFKPERDDLPEFLQNIGGYRPNAIARRGTEGIVIEVVSRGSLGISPYLRDLALSVGKVPGWQLRLIELDPDVSRYLSSAERSLTREEIQSCLAQIENLCRGKITTNLGIELVYLYSLAEAMLRILAEMEAIENWQSLNFSALITLLSHAGILATSQAQLLNELAAIRNAIAHGFRPRAYDPSLEQQAIALIHSLLVQSLNPESLDPEKP